MHASATSVYAKQSKKVRSRQGLSGRGHRPLPQERSGQRTVSPAGLLPSRQHPARRGRTPRGPDLRAQEGGPARGPGRAPALRRPGLVRQARDGLHACFRANHRRLSGSPGPPMKLRAGPQGTGELSRKWGSSEALPTPPGLCAWAGFSVPSGERNAAQFLGSSGNGMLPFFLQLHPGRSPV